MGDVTEVTHRVGHSQGQHLPVVPGGTQVKMVDFTHIAPSATDNAGGGLGDATHLLAHLQAVVGGHSIPVEAKKNCPTGRETLYWCY